MYNIICDVRKLLRCVWVFGINSAHLYTSQRELAFPLVARVVLFLDYMCYTYIIY